MSVNQSRDAQLRRTGRSGSSGHHRGGSGGGGAKGGGGAAPPPISPAPAPSSANASLSTNRSSKKSGNGQGGQSRVYQPSPGFEAAAAAVAATNSVPNGVRAQDSLHGSVNTPAPSGAKLVNTAPTSNPSAAPKASSSLHPSSGHSDSAPPKAPPKGDASGSFLQFGTITPNFVSEMQIPARTSSAPPNLDEQKRDQARHDTFRAVPTMPIPAAQKHQQPQARKDVGIIQSNTGEPNAPTQRKREIQLPIASVSTAKSSVLPVGGMHMSMPFQQAQVPPQFGGPNPQMQSQGITPSSLQMTMALPLGNTPQVQPQMFMSGIHPHQLQTQAMLHQGQGLGFTPQMSYQMTSQFPQQFPQQQPGKFGGPPRKPPVKITDPFTHEELKLDKRTDSFVDVSSSGQRPPPNINPQSQSIPTFNPSHQMNYYAQLQPGTFNPQIFFPTSSLALPTPQIAAGSQPPRYTYPVSQGAQAISFMNHSIPNPIPNSKPGPTPPLHSFSEVVGSEGLHYSATPNHPVQMNSRVPGGPLAERVVGRPVTITPPISKAEPLTTIAMPISKVEPLVSTSMPISKNEAPKIGKADASVTISMPISKAEAPKLLKPFGDTIASRQQTDREMHQDGSVQQPKSVSEAADNISLPVSESRTTAAPPVLSIQRKRSGDSSSAPVTPVGDSGPSMEGTDGRNREPVRRSESMKEHQKKSSKKDLRLPKHQHQIDTSDHIDATKLSSSKIEKDSSGSAVSTRQVSKRYDSVQALPEADASFSTASLASRSAHQSVSSGFGTSEAVEGQAISTESGISEVMLEKEASHDGPQYCSTKLEFGTEEASIKERGLLETATPVDTELNGTISNHLEPSFSPDETSLAEVGQKQELLVAVEYGETEVSNDSSLDNNHANAHPVSSVAESSLVKTEEARLDDSESKIAFQLNDSETKQHDEAAGTEVHKTGKELAMPATVISNFLDAQSISSSQHTSSDASEERISPPDALSNKSEAICSQDVDMTGPPISPLETTPFPTSISSEVAQKLEAKVTELSSVIPASGVFSGLRDKSSVDPSRSKPTLAKKKKKKEILSKADAAGTSDLYNAYKGPEEKQTATASPSEDIDNSLPIDAKDAPADVPFTDVVASEGGQNKAELDDWEDAADASSPKLTSENGQQVDGVKKHSDENGNEATSRKRYSRDFLLTFAEHCMDLPIGFDVGPDIANTLMCVSAGTSRGNDREPNPSSGRITDRPSGASRGDRRTAGMTEEGKWKSHGSFSHGGDHRADAGHGAPGMNFRHGQGANHPVLRNPRGQPSSGILSGPLLSPSSQGGIPRNNADADRWQRGSGFQRGLMPSPQTPLQIMHKADRKYEVGKVSDEEQAKQRQLKGILNKLTPQNFDKLFAQVKEVNIDNTTTLTGVISQIFDKALMEPTFCEMYANFCFHLASALPDFGEDKEKITFRRMLLNKCQEEFERGEREQAEANRMEEEGEVQQSKEEREEKRVQARRRMLGNIRLIGELYKKKMLTERIMHECIKKLLGQYQNPDEEDIESLCKLMSTIGQMIDHPKAKEHMDAYFDMMHKLSNNQKLSSRVRFMLRDAIDLRKNKWQQRRKVEGPKKIEEVHRDAAQERQAQSSRLARGPIISSAPRRGPPVDYGSRGSSVLSAQSSQQAGGIRNLPSQVRGHTQDVRTEDRHQFESRTSSVPLPQRPIDDNFITLVPQGGLARGMSSRGQPPISNAPSGGIQLSTGGSRRLASGPNGYSSIHDRTSYNSRDEIMPGSMPDKFSGERVTDRIITTTPAGRIHGPLSGSQLATSEARVLSEELLREKSISAIREFYSAKDEKEIALCMKELNSPSFYPSMVSLWVTDSFERKDKERDLLAGLLVNLCKLGDSVLGHSQLIQGFDSVLSSLEDAVNDAPRAAEFLGRIFGKTVVDEVVPLGEIGRLIHDGGEEPGRLLEIGLASEVLGSALEFIRTEKGESVFVDEIRTLKLEDFRPPPSIRSNKLDAFLLQR